MYLFLTQVRTTLSPQRPSKRASFQQRSHLSLQISTRRMSSLIRQKRYALISSSFEILLLPPTNPEDNYSPFWDLPGVDSTEEEQQEQEQNASNPIPAHLIKKLTDYIPLTANIERDMASHSKFIGTVRLPSFGFR